MGSILTSLGSNRRTLGKPIAKYFNAIAFYRFYPLRTSTFPLSVYIVNSCSDIRRSVAPSIRAERNRTIPFVSWNERSSCSASTYAERKLQAVICQVKDLYLSHKLCLSSLCTHMFFVESRDATILYEAVSVQPCEQLCESRVYSRAKVAWFRPRENERISDLRFQRRLGGLSSSFQLGRAVLGEFRASF